jgi:hypothetical protein
MTFLEAVDADTLAPAKPWAEDVECDVCGAMGPNMEYLPRPKSIGVPVLAMQMGLADARKAEGCEWLKK